MTLPMSQRSGTRCLKFWYHMYGRDIGQLKITQKRVRDYIFRMSDYLL